MITGINYDICMTQSRIYRYVAQCRYDIKRFSDAFLTSDFCRRAFDTLYSRFQLEDVFECMDFIVPEIQSDLVKASGLVFDEDVAAWIGFIYRQLYIETEVKSSRLVAVVKFQTLCNYYAGLHTVDLEDATDIICRDFRMEKAVRSETD